MRISVLAMWLLPAFCEDITDAATSGAWLTSDGRSIIHAAVLFSILGLWSVACRHFVRDEAKQARAFTFQSSRSVTFEGKGYLMIPLDPETQAEFRKENRSRSVPVEEVDNGDK